MKKSLALVARKKLVAKRKQATYQKMGKGVAKRQDEMESKRLAAKVKPKTKTKAYSNRQRRFPKGNPKGGKFAPTGASLSVSAKLSRTKTALAKRAKAIGKAGSPYAKAAVAGALQGGGSLATGAGVGKFLGAANSPNRKATLATAAGLFLGGRQAGKVGTALGQHNLARIRTNKKRAKVEKFQKAVATSIRVGYSVGRGALKAYKLYRAYQAYAGTARPGTASSAAVAALLSGSKEVSPVLTTLKARKQASYDQLRDTALGVFRAAYPYTEGGTYRYVCEVWPSYMVVDEGGKYYKAPYTADAVAPHSEWVEVARTVEWEAKELHAGLTVFKDKNDDYRWVLLSSNGYRDRDGEIVKTKALEQDVALWDLQEAPPDPLRWWHLSLDDDHKLGLELGYTDFRMVHDHTLIESGTFIGKEVGEAVYNAQDKLAGSIGFRHSPKEPDSDKMFSTVRIFERSLLPKESASNALTHLVVTD